MEARQYFPAMAEQIGFFTYFKFCPPSFMNICARVDFDVPVDEALMVRALQLGFSRLPYCNMRLHKVRGQLMFYYTDEMPRVEPILDLQALTDDKVQKTYEKIARKGIPHAPFDAQMYEIVPARLAGGAFSLMLISSHLVTDGYSQMYSLLYAFKTYDALKNGTELPPPGIDPRPYMEKETAKFHSSVRTKACAWWDKELESEPCFTSLNPAGSREYIKDSRQGKNLSLPQLLGKKGLWEGKFDASLVGRIMDDAKARNVSSQSYFTLALRSYLGYMSRTDDVTLYATVSRRAGHTAKNVGLMLANILPFRTIVSPTETWGAALCAMRDTQMRTYRRTTTDLAVIGNILKKHFRLPASKTYSTVWFTYQPYYDFTATEVKFHGRPVESGLLPAPLYLYIMPTDAGGDLSAEYFYIPKYFGEDAVKKLHTFMVRFLDTGLQHPDLTIEELTKRCI